MILDLALVSFDTKIVVEESTTTIEIRHTFNECLDSIHKTQRNAYKEVSFSPVPIFESLENDDVDQNEHNALTENHIHRNDVKIETDVIQEEIDFWNSAVIYYVVGSNPPIEVMEGFIRRIWKKYNVDKVALIIKGIYIVRFMSMDNRDKVL